MNDHNTDPVEELVAYCKRLEKDFKYIVTPSHKARQAGVLVRFFYSQIPTLRAPTIGASNDGGSIGMTWFDNEGRVALNLEMLGRRKVEVYAEHSTKAVEFLDLDDPAQMKKLLTLLERFRE